MKNKIIKILKIYSVYNIIIYIFRKRFKINIEMNKQYFMKKANKKLFDLIIIFTILF